MPRNRNFLKGRLRAPFFVTERQRIAEDFSEKFGIAENWISIRQS
jgi:hypothetical protein